MVAFDRRMFLRLSSAGAVASLAAACAGTQQVARSGPDPIYHKAEVDYSAREKPGTIVVDPDNHFLYLVEPGGRAIRYGVGVGAEGYGWSGTASVRSKQEWPDWYPTKDYLDTHPKVLAALQPLQSGTGMRGGPENPMGARALYLWQGNKDTLYRIHGTNEPWTIGHDVSAGCIRLTNEDVADLYNRVPVGAKVVVLPSTRAPVSTRQS
jgi:lipoprotein-anchoring transpeptidase ErfK/SrfK